MGINTMHAQKTMPLPPYRKALLLAWSAEKKDAF